MPRTRRIAVLVETSGNLGREIMRGVADWARTHDAGWQLTIEAGDATRTGLLPGWRGHGIICRARGPALAAAVAACDVPRIMLGAMAPPPSRQRHRQDRGPLLDLALMAAAAVRHLRDRGCPVLAFCDHPEQGDFGRGVLFIGRAAASGAAVARWRSSTVRRVDRRVDLDRWVAGLPRGTGIWAANDAVGLLLLEVCHGLGLAVPGDRLVLGCDDDDFLCGLAEPSLSSITPPAFALGQAAASQLGDVLAGRRIRACVLPPPIVATRASTEVAAAADELVAVAANRLTTDGRTMVELAHGLGVSIRTLERRWKRATGGSPAASRRRQRLLEAQRLLAETGLAVTAIANRCGFGSGSRLGEALKRATGMTPSAWRASHRRP